MKLCMEKSVEKIKGKLLYRQEEGSFDFKPRQFVGISLIFGYLVLDFDIETRLATQLWGFHPRSAWKHIKLEAPQKVSGGLKLCDESEAKTGDAFGIVESGEWTALYDNSSGWIRFGDTYDHKQEVAIEFAEGICVVLVDGNIKAFWLHPTFE